MNEIAREKLALAFGSIGMAIMLLVIGVLIFSGLPIGRDGHSWGLMVMGSTPLFFWVSGHLISHALYPAKEEVKRDPADLPHLPTT